MSETLKQFLDGLDPEVKDLVDVRSLETVWELLFGDFEFEDGEYVELAFDTQGDRIFAKANHIQDFEALVFSVFQVAFEGSNAVISTCTKKIKEKNKRTGKDAMYRQKCIILDIDNPNGHQRLTEEEGLELANRVIEEIKRSGINDGISAIGYTGGGVQLYITLDKVLKGKEEIERVYGLLKECLKDIELIDQASFTPSQLQRLLGTYNLKYTPRALSKFLKVFENIKPLSIEILERLASEKKKQQEEVERIKKGAGQKININTPCNSVNIIYKNPDKTKREIKRKLRVFDLDFINIEKKYGDYSTILCPFHRENNPSFVIFHNDNGDRFVDFHTGEQYDIIEFYMKVKNKSEEEAIEELSRIAGVEPEYTREYKKEREKEQKLKLFNAEEYIEHLGIIDIEYYSYNGILTFGITVEDIKGRKRKFTATITELENWKRFYELFRSYTWREIMEIEHSIRKEALKKIVNTLIRIGKELEERNTKGMDIEALLNGLMRGYWANSFEEFIKTTAYTGFKGKDGRYYTTFEVIKQVAKEVGANFNQRELIDLLFEIGCEKIRYYERTNGENIRKWTYILPENFKPFNEVVDVGLDTLAKGLDNSETKRINPLLN